MNENSTYTFQNAWKLVTSIAGSLLLCTPLHAQFVGEDFRGNTVADWDLTGHARLTAEQGIDPIGNGWLRLTANSGFQLGHALHRNSFPSTDGIVAKFDYVMWNSSGNGIAADGMSFFLYDPSVTNPMENAASGASLGYCHGNGGVIGIGLDAIGNFSNVSPGDPLYCSTGRNGSQANAITIRGAVANGNPIIGDPQSPDDLINNSTATNRPAQTRSVQLSILPQANGGYYITLDEGPTGSTLTRLITGDYAEPLPANLSLGFSGSTGLYSQVNEVRMTSITKPIDVRVATTEPVLNGNVVSHTFTLSNHPLAGGAAIPIVHESDAPVISQTTDPSLSNMHWTCVASGAGTTCPEPSGTGPIQNLGGYLLGETGSLTFTVSGTVACATNSVQEHSVSASFPPTSSYDDSNPADNFANASGPIMSNSCAAPTPVPVPFLGHFGVLLLSLIAAGFGALGLNRRAHTAHK